MKEITKYAAFDGKEFDSAAACRKYEAEHAEAKLIGLTAEQLAAAASREPTDKVPDAIEIADAIEDLAKKIRDKRLGDGEFRRKPKGAHASAPAVAQTPAAEDFCSSGSVDHEPPTPPAAAAE